MFAIITAYLLNSREGFDDLTGPVLESSNCKPELFIEHYYDVS